MRSIQPSKRMTRTASSCGVWSQLRKTRVAFAHVYSTRRPVRAQYFMSRSSLLHSSHSDVTTQAGRAFARTITNGIKNMVSDYEQERIRNIERNEAQLRRLGLLVGGLTQPATGRTAPTKATRRRAVPTEPTRRSERIAGLDAAEPSCEPVSPPPKRARVVDRPAPSERSCRSLCVDLSRLTAGAEIAPLGGTQAKRAVMEAASAVPPTFSRMSGIQEWQNCVMLFVNVYGEGYKNVLLNGGREITWFAQPRQWEGTPVIQRLINCAGGYLDDVLVDPTPVLLFCRQLGRGFVYCGRLEYLGHDPDRIPIRFVWRLADFDELEKCDPFIDLVQACDDIMQP